MVIGRIAGLFYLLAHTALFWRKPGHYMAMEIGLQLGLLLPVLLFGLARQRRPAGLPTSGRIDQRQHGIPWWLLTVCLLIFTVGGIAVSRAVTAGRLVSDESAYRFQSRIFASGHVTAPAPPASVFYEHHVIRDGRWFTKFPPGWPALLALSSAAHLEAEINILLGLATLAIVFLTAREVYAGREADLALFLMLFSPLFWGNCLGQMSHPLCGCLLAGSAYFYFRTRRGGSLWAVAGMLGGILAAIQVRPLTGALFGMVLGLSAIWEVRHHRRRLLETVALCGLFATAAVVCCAIYNLATTGMFTQFPYATFSGHNVPIEFIPDVPVCANNLRWGLFSTWVFSFPMLFPAAGYAVFRDREKRSQAFVLALLFLCLVVGYAPDRYTSGSFLGERFYFEGFFAVALLAARGMTLLARNRDVARWPADWLGLLAASSVATLLFTLPVVFHEVEPYANVRLAAEQVKLRNAVVFLQPHDPEFVAKHFNLNRADWPSAPLFLAPDPGPDARPALARALGRPAWVVITYDPWLQKAQVSSPTALSNSVRHGNIFRTLQGLLPPRAVAIGPEVEFKKE
jgi:hypothetical protein